MAPALNHLDLWVWDMMDLKPFQMPGLRAGAKRPGFSNGSREFLMVGSDTDGCRICLSGRVEGREGCSRARWSRHSSGAMGLKS